MFKYFKTGIRASYDVSENPSFVVDLWLIYPAKRRQGGKAASVFIFDKTKFESLIQRLASQSSAAKNPRVLIAQSYELIKFEIGQLARLRHPQILTVVEALEETKLKFIFATEPVSNTLSTTNVKKLDDLTIQKGLLEIGKALHFLHSNCSIIHFNLQPLSIFISSLGDWKLSGFKFLQNLNEISPQERDNFYIMEFSPVAFTNINLNFAAPELLLDHLQKLGFHNDMFSLGLLIYYLYNDDYLISCFDSGSITEYKSEFQKFANKFYNHRPADLKYVLKNIPDTIYAMYVQLMARLPHDRLTIDQFLEADFFEGSVIKAMFFADEFSTKSLSEKLVFILGLQDLNVLNQFPSQFRNQKLLPLMINFIENEVTVHKGKQIDLETDIVLCNALQVALLLGEGILSLTFQDKVYKPLFSQSGVHLELIKTSVRIRLTLVQNLGKLQLKLHDKQLVDLVKELAPLCLTVSAQDDPLTQIEVQESFLTNLETVIHKFDFPYIKNDFFPLLCQVFKTTTILSTKLATINAFALLIRKRVIDKLIVTEQLLPVLKNLKSRNKVIIHLVLQLFSVLSESTHILLDIDVLVDTVLAQCLKLAFGCNDCNQSEFQKFIATITQIQETLTKKKIDLLPKDETTSFASIIETPKPPQPSQTPIKPQKVPSKSSQGSDTSRLPQPVVKQKALVTTSSLYPQTLQSAQSVHEPLHPAIHSRDSLTFGATTPNASNLVNTLHKTWDSRAPTQSGNVHVLPSVSTIHAPKAPAPQKLPPGFDQSMILVPQTRAAASHDLSSLI